MKNCVLRLMLAVAMLAVVPCAMSQTALPIEEGFEELDSYLLWTRTNCVDGSERGDFLVTAMDGNYYFAFQYSRNAMQYLISPEFTPAGGTEIISLWYRGYFEGIGEEFEIGFSTTTNDTSAFIWGSTVNANERNWREHTMAVPAGAKYAAIRYRGNNQSFRLFIDEIYIGDEPLCYKVRHLGVSAATDSSLTLSWLDTTNTSVTYTLYLVTDEYAVPMAYSISGTSYTVTGLDPDREYRFGVQADCPMESTDMVEVSGRTAHAAKTLPFIERFHTSLNDNSDWASCSATAASEAFAGNPLTLGGWAWEYNTSGCYSTHIWRESRTNWLITPSIDLTHADSTVQLSFDVKTNQDVYNTSDSTLAFMVLVSLDGGMTWIDSNAVIWQDSGGRHPISDIVSRSYVHQVVNLDRFAGETIRIAFYAQTPSGLNNIHLYLDNIRVGLGVTCPPVTGLAANDIEPHGATLSWISPVGVYNVIDMVDSTVVATVTDTFAILTGLTPMTSYTFGVSALCSHETADTIAITFTTACGPMPMPFVEPFDVEVNNDCWGKNDSISIYDILAGAELELSHYSTASDGWRWMGNRDDQRYYTLLGQWPTTQWLVTPELDLSLVETAQLSFDLRFNDVFTGTPATNFQTDTTIAFAVLISTDNGKHWIDSSVVWWRNFGGQHTFTEINGTDYINQVINLNSYTGDTIRIAFYAQGDYSEDISRIILNLDNINISTVPRCAPVSRVTVDSIVADTVWLHWNSTATAFDIDLRNDTSAVTDATVTISGNSAVIYGLELNEDYLFTVRSDCGDSVYGEWSETVGIHTGYCLPAFRLSPGEINRVSFGGMTNSTGHPTMWPMYADFSSMTGTVPADSIADVHISFLGSYMYIAIWVDWNENSHFDHNELVFTGYSSRAITARFYVEPEREYGEYRMRVVGSTSASYADPDLTDPCGIPNNGSATFVEDYTLAVGPAPSCLSIRDLRIDSVTSTSIFLSWTDSLNTGATYSIYDLEDSSVVASGITGTSFEVTGLEPSTYYTFGVVANCSANNVSNLLLTVTSKTDCANGSCFVTIVGHDPLCDGWNGNSIKILQNGETVGTYTFVPDIGPFGPSPICRQTFKACASEPLEFIWITRSNYNLNDISFDIINGLGDTVYTITNATLLEAGSLLTLDNACSPFTFVPDSVLVRISSDNTQQGSVTSNLGNSLSAYVQERTTILADATTAEGFRFDHWTVSYHIGATIINNTIRTNTLQLYIDDNMVNCSNIDIKAYFKVIPDSLTLIIMPAIGGTARPEPGIYHLAPEDQCPVTHEAYENYRFMYWTYDLDGSTSIVYDNTITITASPSLINHTITLTPFFESISVIDDIHIPDAIVCGLDGKVVIVGAEGQEINIFDVVGRQVAHVLHASERVEIPTPCAGVYIVRLGTAPARRVIIIR